MEVINDLTADSSSLDIHKSSNLAHCVGEMQTFWYAFLYGPFPRLEFMTPVTTNSSRPCFRKKCPESSNLGFVEHSLLVCSIDYELLRFIYPVWKVFNFSQLPHLGAFQKFSCFCPQILCLKNKIILVMHSTKNSWSWKRTFCHIGLVSCYSKQLSIVQLCCWFRGDVSFSVIIEPN